MTTEERALQRAILIAGSGAALGRLCGVGRAAVQGWKDNGRVPICQVINVERATRFEVTREELCPALFSSAAQEAT